MIPLLHRILIISAGLIEIKYRLRARKQSLFHDRSWHKLCLLALNPYSISISPAEMDSYYHLLLSFNYIFSPTLLTLQISTPSLLHFLISYPCCHHSTIYHIYTSPFLMHLHLSLLFHARFLPETNWNKWGVVVRGKLVDNEVKEYMLVVRSEG